MVQITVKKYDTQTDETYEEFEWVECVHCGNDDVDIIDSEHVGEPWEKNYELTIMCNACKKQFTVIDEGDTNG